LDRREWFEIEYITAKNLKERGIINIASFLPLWVTALKYVEDLIPQSGGYETLEKKWKIFIKNRQQIKQLKKMEQFLKAAKYNFPKLINADICDFTTSHFNECKLEWFQKMAKQRSNVIEDDEDNGEEAPNEIISRERSKNYFFSFL
jgi:hypothetical protein